MTTVHEFKRNNLYRIDTTDGEAFAVSVQIDDNELLELCRIIVGIERQGKTILCVRAIHAISLDEIEYHNTKEYARLSRSRHTPLLTASSRSSARPAHFSCHLARSI